MFFIVSKVLQFLIHPMFWVVLLLIIYVLAKRTKIKRRCFAIALFLLLFTSNSFILDEFMRKWEVQAIEYEKLDAPYDYGIVLSGMMMYDKSFERINFYRSTDRLLQALDLYGKGLIKKIVISGGSGFITHPDMIESRYLKDYLITIGIPKRDIIIETESKNTYENAVNTASQLTDHSEKSCLLITSAFHMRRAIECFEKQGLIATPFVADRYAGPRKYKIEHILLPKGNTMAKWALLIHEVVGYLVYSVMGYL